VFLEALASVAVDDPQQAVFVGDRPYDDIYGARQVGLRTVWRASPDVPPYDVEPDAVIDSLTELIGLIDRWNTETTEVHAVGDRS
jgi:putative hydrolase of the HAD superfamily